MYKKYRCLLTQPLPPLPHNHHLNSTPSHISKVKIMKPKKVLYQPLANVKEIQQILPNFQKYKLINISKTETFTKLEKSEMREKNEWKDYFEDTIN